MHITAIRRFIEDHPKVKVDHLTTSEINSAFVKPETKHTNQSYIQLYKDAQDPTTGIPLVSTATVFVSHAWRYAFYDVVVNVMEQYASRNPDAYFWFDLFTNNQNEVSSKDFDWFSQTFRNSIRDIGQVLLVLSPWNDPIPVQRAWCLFEIHNALEDSEVQLSIDLPSSEVEGFKAGVIEDEDSLIQVLSDVQAEQAEAKSSTDKELIFSVIQESDGGFQHVNQQVKKGLRSWYIEQLKILIKEEPDNSTLLLHSASIMESFDFFNDALFYYNEHLSITMKAFGEDHPDVATACNNMANVYQRKGQFDEAMEQYQKSLRITVDAFGENHERTGVIYNNIANVYGDQGEQGKALEFHRKNLKIELDTFGANSSQVADTYNNIACTYHEKDDLDEAIKYYNKSLTIKHDTLGENHPLVADSYSNMGCAYDSKGETDRALEYHQKSLAIRLEILGEKHSEVASSYNNIANAYESKGEFEEALEHHHKALTIKLELLGEVHPSVGDSYYNIAVLYKSQDDDNTALQFFQKSLQVRLETLGENHPDVVQSQESMTFCNIP